jgi:hypothetical protein
VECEERVVIQHKSDFNNMSAQQHLYSGLLEHQEDESAFVQMYWARGIHLGEAIEKMLAAAVENGVATPTLREAAPCESPPRDVEVYPSTRADVFFSTSRFSFPPEPSFELPAGIIPSSIPSQATDPLDADDIKPGYSREEQDGGLIEIGVNVDAKAVVPVYSKLLRMHDRYETFWYQLHDHWENGQTAFLENPALNQADKILKHLSENLPDSILNGFVTLTAYLGEGSTNINISDHKRIVILTYSQDVAAVLQDALEKEGYRDDPDLVSIDHRIHHWHYRGTQSLDRDSLVRHLKQQGFAPWQPGQSDD